jgi:hypothetical protein
MSPVPPHPLALHHRNESQLTPLGEVDGLLVGLLGDQGSLVLGKTTTDSTGLLVTEVEGEVCWVESNPKKVESMTWTV